MNELQNKTYKGSGIASGTTLQDFYSSYIAALNTRDFAFVATLIPDEVRVNGQLTKREDILTGLQWLTDVVPDYVWHIEDLIVNSGNGERIAVRLRDTGTPAKTFFGAEPTGKSVEFTEFASYKVKDGQFLEMWYLMDTAAITEQLKK